MRGGLAAYSGYALGYIGLSLFDPWVRLAPAVHVAAFSLLLAWGLLTLVLALRSGFSGAFRLAFPQSFNARHIPWVRLGLFGALLVLGLYQAGNDLGRRLYVAFTPAYLTPIPKMRMEVILTPPDYTGLKPVILASHAETPSDGLLNGAAVRVPAGSIITVTVQDTRWQPSLVWGHEAVNLRPLISGGFRIAGKVTADTDVEIRLGSKLLAAWPLQVVADHAPEARMAGAPVVTPRGLLKFHVVARDDYGVNHLALKIRLKDDMDAPEKVVELPAYGTPGIDEDEYVNLLASRWAGKAVTLRVTALDGAGQEGSSLSYGLTLPQFRFHTPLSKALAEARRNVMAGGGGPRLARDLLQSLVSDPAETNPDVTSYLGIRTAYLRLENDPSGEHAQEVSDLLWDLAVRAEDGGMTSARDDLDQALDQLRSAVKKGASKADASGLAGRLGWAFRGYDDSRRKAGFDAPPGTATLDGIRVEDLKEGLDWPALTKFLNRIVDLVNKGNYVQVAADLDRFKGSFEERGDLLLVAGTYRRFLAASDNRQMLMAVKAGQENLLTGARAEPMAAPDRRKAAAGQKALADGLEKIAGNLAKAGLGPFEALTAARRSMAEALAAIRQNKMSDAARAQGQTLAALDGALKALAKVPSSAEADARREDALGRPLPDFSPDQKAGADDKTVTEAIAAPR